MLVSDAWSATYVEREVERGATRPRQKPRSSLHKARMKRVILLLSAVAACMWTCGCESDVQPGSEVPHKIQRGIRGQGTLYQPEQPSGPVIGDPPRADN